MLNILVVDDNEAVLQFMEQLFKKTFRMPVKTATNGKVALEICKNYKPDVICLDISMPEMNGIEFVQKMHEKNQLTDVTTIVMSAVNNKDTIAELLKFGIRNYILKPFNFTETQMRLKKIIIPLLENKKSQDNENFLR